MATGGAGAVVRGVDAAARGVAGAGLARTVAGAACAGSAASVAEALEPRSTDTGAGALLSEAGVAATVGAGVTTGGGVTTAGAAGATSAACANRGVDDKARTAAIAVKPGRSGVFVYLMLSQPLYN